MFLFAPRSKELTTKQTEYWLSRVQMYTFRFQNAPKYIRNNKTIVLAAVELWGKRLKHASPELRNDKDVVMAAVKQYSSALQYASEELRNDEDVVMTAVQKFGRALQFASPELKNDRGFVMAALRRGDHHTLQYASPRLRKDKDVAMFAIEKTGEKITVFGYMHDDLKQDPDLLIAAGKEEEVKRLQEKFTVPGFDGKKIHSRDELDIVIKILRIRYQNAINETTTTAETESSYSLQSIKKQLEKFEDINGQLDSLPIGNPLRLPRLVDVKSNLDKIDGSAVWIENEIKRRQKLFDRAVDEEDYSTMRNFGDQMETLRKQKEKELCRRECTEMVQKEATAAYSERLEVLRKIAPNATVSTTTRTTALSSSSPKKQTPASNPTSPPSSSPKHPIQRMDQDEKRTGRRGRAILQKKLGVGNGSSLDGSIIRMVPYEYVYYLTKGFAKSNRLGHGGQGYVYRGFDQDLNFTVAVKQIPTAWDESGGFDAEMKFLAKLDHPNVVTLLAFSESQLFRFLIYEYAGGGTLEDALKKSKDSLKKSPSSLFTYQRRVEAILQLLLALQYCHNKGVKHRDVKPQNLCFMDEEYRDLLLIDFGIATDNTGTLTSVKGTRIYMAPECNDITKKQYFDEKTEIYSVGVVILAVVTGSASDQFLEGFIAKIAHGRWGWDEVDDAWKVSDESKSIIQFMCRLARKCLMDKALRPTLENAIDDILPAYQRCKSTVTLTSNQTTALYSTLSNSSVSGAIHAGTGKKCDLCGRGADRGIICATGHPICGLCLERTVRRQVACNYISSPIQGSKEQFHIADLYNFLDREVLAEHSLKQQEKRFMRILSLHFEQKLVAMKDAIDRRMDAGFRNIASGIAFSSSNRSDCPSLCILWPVRSGRLLSKGIFCKRYRLYFLCAFDRTPTKTFIELEITRKWVKKILPVLKYSIFAMKIVSTVMGLPLPLPTCVVGDNASDKLESIAESLSDVMESEQLETLNSKVEEMSLNIDESTDEAILQNLLCREADKIDSDTLKLISDVAHKDGNNGWQDEMCIANKGRQWAWVKNDKQSKWESLY